VIEQCHDADGIAWPWTVAPFQVLVVLLDPALDAAAALARELAGAAEAAGADVLLDDRDERPGVKFKDADLIGYPVRITVGPRALERNAVEDLPAVGHADSGHQRPRDPEENARCHEPSAAEPLALGCRHGRGLYHAGDRVSRTSNAAANTTTCARFGAAGTTNTLRVHVLGDSAK